MKAIFSSTALVAMVLAAGTSEVLAQSNNTKYGTGALNANSTGSNNSAFGYMPMYNNTTSGNGTAFGYMTLFFSKGAQNTGFGYQAIKGTSVMAGAYNNAFGYNGLSVITSGSFNSAVGESGLASNTSGSYNSSLGYASLKTNITGAYNTAAGSGALYANVSGNYNTAIGKHSLFLNKTGSNNTVIGASAKQSKEVGSSNTAHGLLCLQTVSGDQNTGFGVQTMTGGNGCQWNTGIGVQSLWRSTGRENIGIGQLAGYNLSSENYNILIGSYGRVGDASTIRVGEPTFNKDAYVAGIHGATVAGGVRVLVNSQGKLGTLTSSRRFKTDIADMGSASEALSALRPVTFHYKPEFDSDQVAQFGLIAEEVAEVSPDLVARDAQGEIYTVRYEAVNAMLLNEFQKLHGRVVTQDALKARQESRMLAKSQVLAGQQTQLEALSQRLSKVKQAMLQAVAVNRVD